MDIPRFREDQVNPTLQEQDFGSAFQQFVHELMLPKYPGLHLFPGVGKDGAIDLSQTSEHSRVVFECKYIGVGGLKEAQKRWRSVAKRLRTHLANSSGPTRGQSQYEPWYRTDPPIRQLVFCISCEIANLNQSDELKTEITDFFRGLAEKHEYLRHLAQLSVEIVDWNDLYMQLQQSPSLMFRWFPAKWPKGLVPLDESSYSGTFRSYLASDKLPYYSLTKHLMTHATPKGLDILDEEGMLNLLHQGSNTGLVITGKGGMGKTRLMLELGQLAKKKGWLVLRVLSRLTAEAVDQLASLDTGDALVLLLVDYVEIQRDFLVLVERLHDLNDTYQLRFRYIATCRTSYYPAISSISRHRQVCLPPDATKPVQSWFEGYYQQRLRHILDNSGLSSTSQRLTICRDIPILAVFLSYLHSLGRDPDLFELLRERDFGTWVAKRIQLSFPQTTIGRELALLVALFPMPTTSIGNISKANYGELFDRLAADGWIEKLPADESYGIETWATIHDVIADQILSSYLSSIPGTIDRFVSELLLLASEIGCLRSALHGLQRLQPELTSLHWSAILGQAMTADPISWRSVRDILLQTSLLTPSQAIDLFAEHGEVWYGAEQETDIKNALGLLARRILTNPELVLDYYRLGTVVSWMQEALRHTGASTFVLRWGIQLDLEAFREMALQQITTQPIRFRTQYLLCAWLRAGGEKEHVRGSIQAWLRLHQVNPTAGFVYQAWLNAGGEREFVQEHLEAWLKEHAAEPEAEFVYQAWLDAGGEREFVQEYLEAWLKEHAAKTEANFVYKAWLDAGGEREFVQEHLETWLKEHAAKLEADFICKAWLDVGGEREFVQEHLEAWLKEHAAEPEADFVCKAWLDVGGEFAIVRKGAIAWLHENREREEAVYLTKFLAKEKDIPIETVSDILVWCCKFPDNEDALWRLTQLGGHLLREEVGEDVVKTSEVVLQSRISGSSALTPLVRSQVNTLFSYLINADHFHKGDFRASIDMLFLTWLRYPKSFGRDLRPHANIQRAFYFQRVVDLIASGTLDVSVDREPLERFLNWVANWQPQQRAQLRDMLQFLKNRYPAPSLWDILD